MARMQVERRATELAKNLSIYTALAASWRDPGRYLDAVAGAKDAGANRNVASLAAKTNYLSDVVWTLKDWHAYGRPKDFRYPDGAKLGEFIAANGTELSKLQGVRLDDSDMDVNATTQRLLALIDAASLAINPGRPPLVGATKLLHCLRPDLVPPIDREGTGWFFGWSGAAWSHGRHAASFQDAFTVLRRIAVDGNAAAHVGSARWHSSVAKVVDNAVWSMR